MADYRDTLAYKAGYEISALRRAIREYRDALEIACDPSSWSAEAKQRLIAQAVDRAEAALLVANNMASVGQGV